MADLIRPAVTPGHSTILLLQNGLNIEVPLFEAFPDNVILSGISICGSSEPESGTIEHNLHDELHIGPFRDVGNATDRAKDIVARYNAGGRCTCHYDSNVTFSRWKMLDVLRLDIPRQVGVLTNDLDVNLVAAHVVFEKLSLRSHNSILSSCPQSYAVEGFHGSRSGTGLSRAWSRTHMLI